MLSIRGKNNSNGSFDWRNALLDALVYAGGAFFTALLVALSDMVLSQMELTIAAVTAGVEFFAILMAKRGLREKGP